MSKSEIAKEIEEMTGVKPKLTKNVLDALAEIAADEISMGNDFTVPGIAKVTWKFRKAATKGQTYKKGETYTGFGGVEIVAEKDSPARKASVRLTAQPTGATAKHNPKVAERSAFLKTKAGKAIAARKS